MKKKKHLLKCISFWWVSPPELVIQKAWGVGFEFISFPGAAHVAHLGPCFENYCYKLFFCG